ncbi:DUF86 domain-containing protein [Halalkalibaculum sp. DA3122]|uniref:HepT-like ribonuclease domain-containing protein n=2 Tax=unclassified Halalkalibaculum TaxID=2964617 RepID=UPI0037540368
MHEYDDEVVADILDNMLWALDQIQKRFREIETASDFLDSDLGLEKLDSICMQLINIGEALKNIDKITHKELLPQYPQIDWKKVMGMRDIITHHYFDIDAETVFTVCDEHVPQLERIIKLIRREL